jgi:hypothetical protein
MQNIIAIIRGVYLLASEKIALKDIGSFTNRVEEPGGMSIRSEVKPRPEEEVIETTISGMGVHRVWHRDVCKLVKRREEKSEEEVDVVSEMMQTVEPV